MCFGLELFLGRTPGSAAMEDNEIHQHGKVLILSEVHRNIVVMKRMPATENQLNFVELRLRAESALRAHSRSVRGSRNQAKIPENSLPKTEKLPSFIKKEVLVGTYNDVFPCTPKQFFNVLLNDDSKFTNEYRSVRKDTNLIMGQWHVADEYDGQVREITFRSICNSRLCPPDTAMTEYQHSVYHWISKNLCFKQRNRHMMFPLGLILRCII